MSRPEDRRIIVQHTNAQRLLNLLGALRISWDTDTLNAKILMAVTDLTYEMEQTLLDMSHEEAHKCTMEELLGGGPTPP